MNWVELLRSGAQAGGVRGLIVIAVCLFVYIVLWKISLPQLTKKDATKIILAIIGLGGVVFVLSILASLIAPAIAAAHTQNIDVVLKQGNQLLRENFTLVYTLAESGRNDQDGTAGHLELRGVPDDLVALRVLDVTCPGYTTRQKAPFDSPLLNGIVEIDMVEDAPSPPLALDQLPDASEFVPSREAVVASPAVDPKRVIFKYRNLTGLNARLALYNCMAHYEPWENANTKRAKWMIRPFPASSQDRVLEGFDGGSGWFVFYFQEVGTSSWHRLLTAQLFKSSDPLLVVSAAESGEITGKLSY